MIFQPLTYLEAREREESEVNDASDKENAINSLSSKLLLLEVVMSVIES